MFPFSQWRREPLHGHHERRRAGGGRWVASKPGLVEAEFGIEDAVEARHESQGWGASSIEFVGGCEILMGLARNHRSEPYGTAFDQPIVL